MKNLRLIPLAGLFIISSSHADTIPVQNTTLNVTFDKRGIPSSLYIWDGLSGGESPDNPPLLGRNSLLCLSTSDTTNGACPVRPVWWANVPNPAQAGVIPLSFCSAQNKCKDINITAYHSISTSNRIYQSYVALVAVDNMKFTNKFYYIIPHSSLSELSPGIWKATLKQNLMQWDPYIFLNTWTADITLRVTDTGSQTIFFPAFPGGAPHVDLNLSNRPAGSNSTASGTANLDMCLYDGGITANNIAITFSDENKSAPGRNSGGFSVYRDGGSEGKAQDRIDYTVQVLNPLSGRAENVTNGSRIDWVGRAVSDFNRRQVIIPGVSGDKWCVYTPITLKTPPFVLADKAAGHYTGTLTVTYAPTTSG